MLFCDLICVVVFVLQKRVEVATEGGERRLQSHRLHLPSSGNLGTTDEEMSRQMVSECQARRRCLLYFIRSRIVSKLNATNQ